MNQNKFIIKLSTLVGLVILLFAGTLSRSASAQNVVELRNVLGAGFWNDDNYEIDGALTLGPDVPDGRYLLSFVEHNGAPNAFSFTIAVTGGIATPALWQWGHQAREVADSGWTISAVDAVGFDGAANGIVVPASGEITVCRVDTLYPDGNVPPEETKIFNYPVFLGATPTPTPSPTPNPNETPPQLGDSHKGNDGSGGGTGEDGGGDNTSVNGGGNDKGCHWGMARYTVDLMTVSLRITDTPLGYSPPVGPSVDFTVAYNQRDADQNPTQQYSNLGPNWTFNWLSYVTDDPQNWWTGARVYVRGGGTETYPYDLFSHTYRQDAQSMAVLTRPFANKYEKTFPDGSKLVYGHSNGATSYPRLFFLTEAVDSAGNKVTIQYDSMHRIDTITDALNQVTHFSYESSDPYKITKVTDPFTRYTTLGYNASGKLSSTTDPELITSQFGYAPNSNFINSLTTPYGTVSFEPGESGTNRWLNMTDSDSMERVEYRDNAPGIGPTAPPESVPNGSEFVNAGLNVRNTFYWDRKALSLYPPVGGVYDYKKAKITHWLRTSDGLATSGTMASEKKPLERRVWYAYEGQPSYSRIGHTAQPKKIARVLGDGTTQVSQFEYNALGNVTKVIDPLGRSTTSIYDPSGIDLIEVHQTTDGMDDLLRVMTYYPNHLVHTDQDASGQTTTFTYNSRGQIETRTNALGQVTTYAYGNPVPDGYLKSITSPELNLQSSVTTYTYDSAKRVHTVTTSPDQYTVTTEYDKLNRKTRETFPDQTFRQFTYTDNLTGAMTLDVTSIRDRRGLISYRHYNSKEQLDQEKDPRGKITYYNWCACGELESIIDPLNQTTTFYRDLQGRVYQKRFNDGQTIDYLFEGQQEANKEGASSRLESSTDALQRRTNYTYEIDDNISTITYTDTSGAPLDPPTPSVSYTYYPDYNRMETMTDGIGLTHYSYYEVGSGPGVGKIHLIDGPYEKAQIEFYYDELGRIQKRSLASDMSGVEYDSLGRIVSIDNLLGSWHLAYDGVTSRVQSLTYPNNQTANYSYYGNSRDRRLFRLQNLDPHGGNFSKFDYSYDPEGQIGSWIKTLGGVSSGLWFTYDPAQRLTGVRNTKDENAATRQLDYGYDDAGNRTSDGDHNPNGQQNNGTLHTYYPNEVNEISTITTQVGGAFMPRIEPIYDAVGNLTDDGAGTTFEWDAGNRLVATNNIDGTRSEFTYDGLSRRVQIVESSGGTILSTRRFIWVENEIVQERDENNDILRDFFPNGEQLRNANGNEVRYYTHDHLGSIREVTDSGGNVMVRYDYEPYGERKKLSGSIDADFGYAGYYHHMPSGMNLTLHRAYNPMIGRWISRDPAGETGGVNLYRYGANSPINNVDPSGLCPGDWWDLFEQFAYGAEEGAYAWIDRVIPGADPFSDRYNANDPGIAFSQGMGSVSQATLATAIGVGGWNAAGLPTFQVSVITSPNLHFFYGVTEGGATTFLHAAGAEGAIVTSEAAGLAGYVSTLNTISGIPIVAPGAAAAVGISASNCLTGACGAFVRGLTGH